MKAVNAATHFNKTFYQQTKLQFLIGLVHTKNTRINSFKEALIRPTCSRLRKPLQAGKAYRNRHTINASLSEIILVIVTVSVYTLLWLIRRPVVFVSVHR